MPALYMRSAFRLRLLCLPLLALLVNGGCQTHNQIHTEPAFYWWTQNFDIQTEQLEQLQNLGVKTIYIKFFDIKNIAPKGAQPAASIAFSSPLPAGIEIIPCIYISNDVFLNPDTLTPDSLAQRTAAHLLKLLQNAGNPAINELQTDCDWSNATRNAYFGFIKSLKKQLPQIQRFSATIRLHQVKYFEKTGIPPADRGLLMYYNMTNVKQLQTRNSILDNREGARYLPRQMPAYPLPLDMALPMFEWSVLFRNGQFKGIFNSLNRHEIENTGFLKPLKNNFFTCTIDTVFENMYLRNGDLLRLETIGLSDLQIAADICNRAVNTNTFRVAFFHLNSTLVKPYTHENIQDICHRFR
ncbi:hypothetical protein C7N43_18620 [Sphingobacteriales bacterium UPWRP_1]|nr:hypothetical protein B6N25_07815 [Sphingobacteriales bacterium TSM_CSS]PSJ75526.1 hypothetical protein C7N43_18620 [Sphingobacteriales bacterium UPWRP_1]